MQKRAFFRLATIFCTATFFFFIFGAIFGLQKQAFSGEGKFSLTSPAFQYGDTIPSKYTCDGVDISPSLVWENPPSGTSYYTLLVSDPDAPAGNWIHWNVTYIPGNITALDEGVPAKAELPNGIKQGKNTWGTIGYRGPCPPGGTHRYFFVLTACDENGRELGRAVLMGKYR